ncbi:MAG TPA: DUF932 domain-containing protein [Noviherbaspirillum sp.]|nr:DUF932 domain-containing protein [Noviherbaspirillum sp.]
MLASRFGRGMTSYRSDSPLTDDQIRHVAPSIFAEDKHASRSDRYAYIPTIEVLNGLRKEGFQPFMVCQSRVRDDAKREHAKHMIRLRHANQITAQEADEIILLNSHDGTSSYQMLAGQFVFVCGNGLVCGKTQNDVRVRHQGKVVDAVIEGANVVLEGFDLVREQREGMKALQLNDGERAAFARAALELRYGGDEPAEGEESSAAPKAFPITERQLLQPRRPAESGSDLWTTFNVVQENTIRGGLYGRNASGKRATTRAVTGIDQNVKLNRALWVLAEEMRRLKG